MKPSHLAVLLLKSFNLSSLMSRRRLPRLHLTFVKLPKVKNICSSRVPDLRQQVIIVIIVCTTRPSCATLEIQIVIGPENYTRYMKLFFFVNLCSCNP